MADYQDLLEKVESLQNTLVSQATGGGADNAEYKALREELLANPLIRDRLPQFVRTCRDLGQFWQFIKYKYGSYRERRDFLWNEFQPLLETLESRATTPSDQLATELLSSFDPDAVNEMWQRALDRRVQDPEGAITAARTLLETVCKHILDERSIAYDDDTDLPKLYRFTAESLNIAPSQHSEKIFKQILGGCTAVVEGLGALRNRLGDAHGKGKKPARAATRHAELAVNLAGTMATFLIATWKARHAPT
jgi:hypothetical protein